MSFTLAPANRYDNRSSGIQCWPADHLNVLRTQIINMMAAAPSVCRYLQYVTVCCLVEHLHAEGCSRTDVTSVSPAANECSFFPWFITDSTCDVRGTTRESNLTSIIIVLRFIYRKGNSNGQKAVCLRKEDRP